MTTTTKHAQSQSEVILAALRRGESLTSLAALEQFGCMRLASRINDLKVAGHRIDANTVTGPNGKRYASYSMPSARLTQGEMFARLVTL